MSQDLSLVPDATNGLRFATSGDAGRAGVSAGALKLASQVVRYLLTEKGSGVSPADYGGELIQLTRRGVDRNNLAGYVQVALSNGADWLKNATRSNVRPERLRELRYLSSAYDGTTLSVSMSIINDAGEQVSIALPVS